MPKASCILPVSSAPGADGPHVRACVRERLPYSFLKSMDADDIPHPFPSSNKSVTFQGFLAAAYNYKKYNYINYVFFIGRFPLLVTLFYIITYGRIPTFSRKASQHFRARKYPIPTFSRRISQHFRANLRIPTFSRKTDIKESKKRRFMPFQGTFLVKYLRLVFRESQHFRARILPNPNIFAQGAILTV